MNAGGTRALALTAIVGSWLFTVTWLVAPLWQDHYRPIDQAVSEMGGRNANLPGLMNGGFVVWAIAIAAAAAAVHLSMPPGRWRTGAVVSLALSAVAMIAIAVFPLDCSDIVSRSCYDRFHAGDLSWQTYAHDWASELFRATLAVSALAIAGYLRPRAPRLAWVPLVGGVLGLAGVVSDLLVDPAFDPHSHYGLYQRIGLLVSAGWIGLLGTAVLMRLEARRAASPWASAAPPRWSAGRRTRPSA